MITCPKHEEKPKSCSGCRFEMDHYGDPKCMFDDVNDYDDCPLIPVVERRKNEKNIVIL